MGDRSFTIDYQEPQSVEEAILRKNALGVDIEQIQTQMASRNRTVNGRRLTDREYWEWHAAAAHARACKIEELKRLKEYLLRHSVLASPRGRRSDRENLIMRCLRALLLDAPLAERQGLAASIDAFFAYSDTQEGSRHDVCSNHPRTT